MFRLLYVKSRIGKKEDHLKEPNLSQIMDQKNFPETRKFETEHYM